MFKPYYGQCEQCPAETNMLIVINKPHLCSYHNRIRKGKNIVISKLKIRKKATGELEMFKQIWSEREHLSEISNQFLGNDLKPVFFSHILTKGAFPKFRLNPENIVLMTQEEHLEWEFGDRNDAKFAWVKEKYEQLKQQYYQN